MDTIYSFSLLKDNRREVREAPLLHKEQVNRMVKPEANHGGAAAPKQVPQAHGSLRNKHMRHLKAGIRKYDNSISDSLP